MLLEQILVCFSLVVGKPQYSFLSYCILFQVPCQGISSLKKVDFEYAKMMRSTIKLLGTAMLSPDGGKLSVFVSPVLVPLDHPIASARGPGNIVSIESKVSFEAGGEEFYSLRRLSAFKWGKADIRIVETTIE